MTGSNGVLRGASGGHSDTAAGADSPLVTAPLVRGRIPRGGGKSADYRHASPSKC